MEVGVGLEVCVTLVDVQSRSSMNFHPAYQHPVTRWTPIYPREINANVYRHSFFEYSKRFHFSFEWHLTPHMTLSIETCIRRTPCIN